MPLDNDNKSFDFDGWRRLFETSPEMFEQRRAEAIESVIRTAPTDQQPRLRGLQWQIDAVRARYKHPLVSATKLFEMMWDKVYGEQGLQNALTRSCVPVRVNTIPEAQVIEFGSYRRSAK